MLFQYQDNIIGLMVYLSFLWEAMRFACFALLWVKPMYQHKHRDIVCNVLLSILGEIYTHTQIWQHCKNERQMRLCGRRYDDFSDVYHRASSIRSLMEYAAPVILTTQCQHLVYLESTNAWTTPYFSGYILNEDGNVLSMHLVWNALPVYRILC